MKKLVTLLFSLLCLICTFSLFAQNPITVKSGNISVLSTATTASYEFDYSATKVDKQTLNEYLKSMGEDFVKEWPIAKEGAEKHFPLLFNKMNKKKMQISDAENVDYKMKIKIQSINMGEDAVVFVPYAPRTLGGAVITGTVDIIDNKTKNVVLSLDMGEVKGPHALTVRFRILLVYDELAKFLAKVK